MSSENQSWKRFAAAVRRLDADTAKPDDPAQPAAAIPWLHDLSAQVQVLWLRLIWKRWALTGIIVSLAVLAAFFLASRPASPAARLPRIPVPAAP